MNNKKAQGALEYLLLIGGAIFIAAILLLLLVSAGSAEDSAKKNVLDSFCAKFSQIQCGAPGNAPSQECVHSDCKWDSEKNTCTGEPKENRSTGCFGGLGLTCATACDLPQVCYNGSCVTPTCSKNEDCDDSDACTTDTCANAEQGNAACLFNPVACISGDGCCPPGCTHPPDSDCGATICTPDSVCTAGENCPGDNDYCNAFGQHQVCKIGACTNGCKYNTNIPDGTHDAGYCDAANGCSKAGGIGCECQSGACIDKTECSPGSSQSCNTGLPGVCSAGTQICQAGGTWGVCTPTISPGTLTENCSNSADDDCDGFENCADSADCMFDNACQKDCVTVDPENLFKSLSFEEETGDFALEFNAIPEGALTAWINIGNANPISILFTSSQITINGLSTPFSFERGKKYHFRITIITPLQKFSAFITPENGTEQLLADNFSFASQASSINTIVLFNFVLSSGSLSLCSLNKQATSLYVSAGTDKILISGQATLDGYAGGGTAPYTYSWSPATGLSNANALQPTVSGITETTEYTLAVADNTGSTGKDSVTVFVNNVTILNNGQPVLPGPVQSGGQLKSVSTSNGLYYFATASPWGDIAARLNFQTMNWETWAENSWSSTPNAIPKPLTLHQASSCCTKVLEFSPTEIMGVYTGRAKTLYTTLDVHGALLNFILASDGQIRHWSGGTTFDEYKGQSLLNSWDGIFGDIAVDGKGSAIIVGNYGWWFGNVKSRITALKYFPNDPVSKWKLWNNGNWKNWHTYYRSDYNSIPVQNMGTKGQGNAKIWYLPQTNEYLVVFIDSDATTDRCLSAAIYKDSAPYEWKYWNGSSWTKQEPYLCFDIGQGKVNFTQFSTEQITVVSTSNGKASVIIEDSYANHSLYEIVYDATSQQWASPEKIAEGISNWKIAKDKTNMLWVFYVKNQTELKIKKKNAVWGNEENFLMANSNIAVLDAAFAQNNAPIIFVKQSDSKVYAYSNNAIGDNPSNREIAVPAIGLDSSKVSFVNKWKGGYSRTSYQGGTPNHMAIDDTGKIYSPAVVVSSVIIKDQETDDPQYGNFWGGFWDYFSFTSGVAIDNSKGKVYVSDTLITGGGGGLYGGKVQVFEKSLGNQDLWWLSYGGSPSGTLPARVYPPTLASFTFPSDVAVDEANGFLYVSDSMNHRIRQYNVAVLDAGNRPTFVRDIGSRGSGNGQFLFPQAIDVDELGNLYVADAGNHRIQKFSKDSAFITSFGTYGINANQLLYPYGLAVDKQLNLLYITDPFAKKVAIYSKQGQFLYSFNHSDATISLGAGVLAYGNGTFAVSHNSNYISKFEITDLTDNNNNKIPDVLE